LNSDKVDGKDVGTLSAAGGIVYASSTTALAGTAAGTAGQAVISGGASAPTFQTVASANGASTIVARDADGSFSANVGNFNVLTISTGIGGDGSALSNLNAANITIGTIENTRTTGSSSNGANTLVLRDANGDFSSRRITSTIASGTSPFVVTSTTAVTNLNADLLDGQHGSYYLDWTNTTNKPDPVVTVTLTGDVAGTANTTLTDLANGTISVATTIQADSVALGTDTTGNYVATIAAATPGSQSGTSGLTISATAGEGTAATIAHADTSTQASVNNSNGTVIQDITLDGFGHITALASVDLDARYLSFKTLEVTDTNSGYTWSSTGNVVADLYDDRLVFVDGDGVDISADATNDAILIQHTDTSTLNGAQGGNGIASITVDGFGHVTAVGTATYLTSQSSDFGNVKIDNTDTEYTWVTTDGTTVAADTTADTLTLVARQTASVSGIVLHANTGLDAIAISHGDTSTLTGAQGSAGIASITVDGMGHVTAVSTATYLTSQSTDFKTITVSDTNSGYTWTTTGSAVAEAVGDTLTIVDGDGVDISVDATNDAILIQHTDTSTQASVNNSNGTVIQDITLDGFGHITALASVDLDARYLAFRTIEVTDTNSGYTWSTTGSAVADAYNDTLKIVDGDGVDISADATNDSILIQHTDTSTLNGAQGGNGIASITVDGFGHVTAVSTATYLTAEADTLQTVTNRGATTTVAVSITNTTASTSTTTGALKVSGGVGIAGALNATSKSFIIDHPTKPGMLLRYGSLEGPELGVYVRGKSKESVIKLPDYWTDLVHEDTITVNLTPIGSHQQLFVSKVENNEVHVESSSREMNYFYTIFAERKDVDKLVVEYADEE
jgi:hypothetical protein